MKDRLIEYRNRNSFSKKNVKNALSIFFKSAVFAACFNVLFSSCTSQKTAHEETLTSIQLIDRNGFKETISSPDRLSMYSKANYFAPQPYEKVTRMFGRTDGGKTLTKLTTYHENGQIWQYLEVVNGRASGVYREWHDNGALRLDVVVIEGLGDLNESAQKGWIFDGVSKAYDSNERVLAEINYEKGKLQGKSLYYHPNGTVSKMIPYEADRIDGDLVYYDESGKVIGKTPYINGKIHGVASFKGDRNQPPYSEEYRDDLLINATYHDFSGKMMGEVANGSGEQAIYIDGVLRSIREYQNGVPEGEVKCFNSHGELSTVFHMKGDHKHGPEWVYYPMLGGKKPRPKLYIEWTNDGIQGICRTWYVNGNLESEREIRDNVKHGISSAWYQDGSVMMIEEYEKDILRKGTYFKKGEKSPVSTVENGDGTATFYDSSGFFIKRALYQKGQPVDEI